MPKHAKYNRLQQREIRLMKKISRLRQSIGQWRETEEGPYAEKKLNKLVAKLSAVRRQMRE